MNQTQDDMVEAKPLTKFYVLYCLERLRDGSEECCWIVPSLEAAGAKMNRLRESFGGDNREFRLFHLGTEIPLPPAINGGAT